MIISSFQAYRFNFNQTNNEEVGFYVIPLYNVATDVPSYTIIGYNCNFHYIVAIIYSYNVVEIT